MNGDNYRIKVFDPFMDLWRSLPSTYKPEQYEQAVQDANGLLVCREFRHSYPRVAIWQGGNLVAMLHQTPRQALAGLAIPAPRAVKPHNQEGLSDRWTVVTAAEAEGLPFSCCYFITIVSADHEVICADPLQRDSMEWDGEGNLFARAGYSKPRSVAIHASDFVVLENSQS